MTPATNPDLIWRNNLLRVYGVPFQHRQLNASPDGGADGGIGDMLRFHRDTPSVDCPPIRFVDTDTPRRDFTTTVFVWRRTRADARNSTKHAANVFGFADAYLDEVALQSAAKWDTKLHFVDLNGSTPNLSIDTFLEPTAYDRFLTMPLNRCYLSLRLHAGVRMTRADSERHAGPEFDWNIARFPATWSDAEDRSTKSSSAARVETITICDAL